ncbi:hypothetical protein L873DRAFT_1803215 [Choiromyces venosus 120613-1]|uniref:Extracellular membrane protein CFEM domain-containing protein n=1 Tax=Choiromyces venosus 120613-1 TaxID=1336337 RepID=A0A3N4JT49_9PEZI|nr:hypothetical protein L873DRAFT_1803215 [Choiromyces venosus 120613-1]
MKYLGLTALSALLSLTASLGAAAPTPDDATFGCPGTGAFCNAICVNGINDDSPVNACWGQCSDKFYRSYSPEVTFC